MSEGWDQSVPDAMDPGGRYNRERVRTGFGNRGVWVNAAVHDALIAVVSDEDHWPELDSEAKVVRYCIKLGLAAFATEAKEPRPFTVALSKLRYEEIMQRAAAERELINQIREATNHTLTSHELEDLREWAKETVNAIQDPDKRAQFQRYMGRL